jgi:sugar O-acyltransferase (sialic acid O-acetyltransferase NeuD family)
MNNIIVIGAGGHAAEISDYLERIISIDQSINLLGFLDDNLGSYNQYQFNAPYLGTIKEHQIRPDVSYIIGIAAIHTRKQIINHFVNNGAHFTSLIHPSAYISPSASVGKGVIIAPYANIGPKVIIGDFNLLNARCSIGHDSILGTNNFVTPNVSFSGNTCIGDDNLFGINSATIPGISIGSRNTIAAGMVLDRSIADDTTVFFRHKEKIIAIPKIN